MTCEEIWDFWEEYFKIANIPSELLYGAMLLTGVAHSTDESASIIFEHSFIPSEYVSTCMKGIDVIGMSNSFMISNAEGQSLTFRSIVGDYGDKSLCSHGTGIRVKGQDTKTLVNNFLTLKEVYDARCAIRFTVKDDEDVTGFVRSKLNVTLEDIPHIFVAFRDRHNPKIEVGIPINIEDNAHEVITSLKNNGYDVEFVENRYLGYGHAEGYIVTGHEQFDQVFSIIKLCFPDVISNETPIKLYIR